MTARVAARIRTKVVLITGCFAATASLVVASPATAAQLGRVSFYRSDAGEARTFSYPSCDGSGTWPVPGEIRWYDNQPIDGCRVQVSVRGSNWYTLCLGGNEMPAAYRVEPTVRITAGSTPEHCIGSTG
jgi:hypothetical protein